MEGIGCDNASRKIEARQHIKHPFNLSKGETPRMAFTPQRKKPQI
jgi:hypothetical protein